MFVPGLGYLQDGGVGRYNNPIDPATWESRIIYPSNAQPDFTVSIGTGYARKPTSPKIPHTRSRWTDGYLFRLFRSFMSSLDGQNSWSDHLNRLDDEARGNHFRLNISLKDAPKLDEIDKMHELRRGVQLHCRTNNDRTVIVWALLASSFFFELDERLTRTYQGKDYECRGSILCRSPDSSAIVRRVVQESPSAAFVTNQGVT